VCNANMPSDTSFNQPHGWRSFERLLNSWLLLVAVGGLVSPTLALALAVFFLTGVSSKSMSTVWPPTSTMLHVSCYPT
jgi:hypothetical protein